MNTTNEISPSTYNIFTAVTGRANAGKSSLTNLLVGEKIAIVSDKPQTTRTRINGVLTKGDTQYVFIDTPGMHRAKNKLSEHMVKSIRTSIADVDAALLMADCTRTFSRIEEELIASFKTSGTPVILLLNKIDLMKDKSRLLAVIDEYQGLYDFAEIIPISVKTGANCEAILPALARYRTEGVHHFPGDIATDQSEKLWLAEILREKLLHVMHEEIPHGIAVQIESMEEATTNKGAAIIDLGAIIICEKASHKGMVIGKQGESLKRIGSVARAEMEEYFGCKVNMKLWVKVGEDWRNRESMIADLGLASE